MTIDTNELRMLAQMATPGPWMIDYVGVGFEVAAGESVIAQSQQIKGDMRHKTRKANAAFIAAANPAAISDLLDRLEAAEKEIALKERVIDALGSELNAVANERDALQVEVGKLKGLEVSRCVKINGYIVDNARLAEEVERLRAKIAEMEKQEPVRHEFQGRDGDWYPFIDERHYETTLADGSWPIRPLYALPGAKGE